MRFYLFLVDDEEDKKPADDNSKDYLFTLFFLKKLFRLYNYNDLELF